MNRSHNSSSSPGGSGNWWSRMSRSEQVVAAVSPAIIAGIFTVIVAIINHEGPPPNKPSSNNSGVVAIDSPSDNKSAPSSLIFNKPSSWKAEGKVISVTLTGAVPRDKHLWIFVHHAGNYYVQGNPASAGPDLWSLPGVNLGSNQASDINSWYTVYAVLADSHANKQILAEYDNSHDVNYGVSKIPDGTGAKKVTYINLYRSH